MSFITLIWCDQYLSHLLETSIKKLIVSLNLISLSVGPKFQGLSIQLSKNGLLINQVIYLEIGKFILNALLIFSEKKEEEEYHLKIKVLKSKTIKVKKGFVNKNLFSIKMSCAFNRVILMIEITRLKKPLKSWYHLFLNTFEFRINFLSYSNISIK